MRCINIDRMKKMNEMLAVGFCVLLSIAAVSFVVTVLVKTITEIRNFITWISDIGSRVET